MTKRNKQMRKLKLQMQVSADGMIAAPKGQRFFNWDDEVRQYSIANAENVDCILLGRKTATGFIPHWKSVADNPNNADCEFGALVSAIPKVVFSKILPRSEWSNATVENGEIADAVTQMKKQSGKDLLAYGESCFLFSFNNHPLIKKYFLLLNPVSSETPCHSRWD